MTLDELRDTLVRMHRNGLSVGLPEAAASELTRALAEGSSIAEAASLAGLDGRLADAARTSEAPDAPTVLIGLAATAGEVEAGAARLRSAAFYPLALGLTVLLSGLVVVTVGLPALAIAPAADPVMSSAMLTALVGGGAALLAVLSVLVFTKVRIPLLVDGWALLDRFAFAESLRVLSGAGAPLSAAVRASGLWGRPPARAAAERWAASLEGGARIDDLRPLLEPFEASVLNAAAGSGTVEQAATALAAQRRVALTRGIPDAVLRVQAAALLLAGGAMLTIAATFYSVYSRVLLG